MAAAGEIRTPFRAATCQALIGLLAATGMRVGEAIGLDQGDLDAGQGLLTIRDGKFGKSQQLPLHASVLEPLARYARLRDSRPGKAGPSFFTSVTGTRLIYQNVHFTFHGLTKAAGLRPRSAACRPRIHDCADVGTTTTCGTPPPCGSCTPASKCPSSRSGSATSRPRPPGSTSTPTSPSRRKHSPGPRHPEPAPAATDRLTRSWPSSKAFEICRLQPHAHPATSGGKPAIRITNNSA